MSIPNELFSSYLIQYCVWHVHFSLIYSFVFLPSLEILADCLNASILIALILLLSSSYKLQVLEFIWGWWWWLYNDDDDDNNNNNNNNTYSLPCSIHSNTESSNTQYMPYGQNVFGRAVDKKWLVSETRSVLRNSWTAVK